MGHERRDLGARGESLASGYLVGLGWEILDRNWRCPEGEIDIVARDPDQVVVICEVKTRSGRGFGTPLEAITHQKARRLRRLAAAWVRTHDGPVPAVRIDAIGVLFGRDDTAAVEHLRGIEP
ncbi:MAG: YraN family protein [Propioniciclava sp.]